MDLFNFDYRIEVYTPAPKRKYGYFTLPILYNNALIGRIDPKAHRKEGLFEVKALHLEPGVVVDDALVAEVKSALQACARFAKQIVAQDTAGRRPVCGQTWPCQTAFGLPLVPLLNLLFIWFRRQKFKQKVK